MFLKNLVLKDISFINIFYLYFESMILLHLEIKSSLATSPSMLFLAHICCHEIQYFHFVRIIIPSILIKTMRKSFANACRNSKT